MSQSSWLVAAIVPGLKRQPLKKLAPDQERRITRWEHEHVLEAVRYRP